MDKVVADKVLADKAEKIYRGRRGGRSRLGMDQQELIDRMTTSSALSWSSM